LIERLVSSFRYKTYRTYWIGSMIAMVTFRIQDVALSWQVLEETNSSFMLGLVVFAYGVPLLICGPITGILADHIDRQLVIGGALVAAAFASAGLAMLVLLERVVVWQIVATSFLLGTAFTLYAPARLALLPRTVPCGTLVEASTVEYSSTRVMGFLGPMLAGFLIDSQGVMVALLLQTCLFLLSTAVFQRTTVDEVGGEQRLGVDAGGGFVGGLNYLRNHSGLSALMVTGLVVVPFGMIYNKLMPVFVRDVLGGDASALGLLLGASSLGTALSGFVIAAVGRDLPKGRVLLLSSGAFGCGLVVLSLSSQFVLAAALLFVVGLLVGSYLTLSNVLLQSVPPDALRGRVMGIWGMVWGILPLATLAAGAAADVWGVKTVIGGSGVVCAVFSLGMAVCGSRLGDLA